jgi:hypothetical protein
VSISSRSLLTWFHLANQLEARLDYCSLKD